MRNESSAVRPLQKKRERIFQTQYFFYGRAAPPALRGSSASDACLTSSRSPHAAGPLVLLPGTCGGTERARFCFLSLLCHSGVLARGQRPVKLPAGWSRLVIVGHVPHSVEERPAAVANPLHVHSTSPGGRSRGTRELE